jgi:predicted nucleotidyltransferase
MSTTGDLSLANDLARIREVVTRLLHGRGVRVWLFGSHASGTARRSSDVDVALLGDGPVPAEVMLTLREALDDAPVLRRVDLVDLSEVEPVFAARVMAEGIPWDV